MLRFQLVDVQETYARGLDDDPNEHTQLVALFGRTLDDRKVALLVRDTPHEIYVAVGRDFSLDHAETLARQLNDFLLSNPHMCRRTQCENGCESKTMFISRELCRRDRRFDTRAVVGCSVSRHFGFEGYERDKRPFCRFVLSRSYFATKAKEFLLQCTETDLGRGVSDEERGVYECTPDCVQSFLFLKRAGGFLWYEADTTNAELLQGAPVVSFDAVRACSDMGVRNAPFRTLVFDIEAVAVTYKNSESARFEYPVGCIGFAKVQAGTPTKHEVFMFGGPAAFETKDDVTLKLFDTELDMLLAFRDAWAEFQPDLVTGYNSNKYDIPYVLGRASKLLREQRSEDEARRFTEPLAKFNRILLHEVLTEKAHQKSTTMIIDCPGTTFPDEYVLLKDMHGFRPYDYKLDTVAEWFELGGKHDFEYEEIHPHFFGTPEMRGRLAAYNHQDVVLTRRIAVEKINLLNNFIASCQVQKCRPSDDINRGLSFRLSRLAREFMYDAEGVAREYLMMSWESDGDGGKRVPARLARVEGFRACHDNQIPGGFVVKPVPGKYTTPTLLFDLNSLYPNLDRTYNFCRSTQVPSPTAHPDVHVSPKNFAFVKQSVKEGVYPRIMRTMIDARTDARERMARTTNPDEKAAYDALQQKYKVIANSLYGQMAARTSELTLKSAGASITTAGAKLALDARVKLENEPRFAHLGLRCIYGDTDSVFFNVQNMRTVDECRHAYLHGFDKEDEAKWDALDKSDFRELQIECARKVFPVITRFINEEAGVLSGTLKFGMDDLLDTLLLLDVKKCYAKVSRSIKPLDPKRKLKIVGWTTRQMIPFVNSALKKLLEDALLKGEDLVHTTQAMMQDILMGRVPLKLLKHTSALTKPIEEYSGVEKHVVAAKQLREHQVRVEPGDRVTYYYAYLAGTIPDKKGSRVVAGELMKDGAFCLDYAEYAREFATKIERLQPLYSRPLKEVCDLRRYERVTPQYRSAPANGGPLERFFARTQNARTQSATSRATSQPKRARTQLSIESCFGRSSSSSSASSSSAASSLSSSTSSASATLSVEAAEAARLANETRVE